MALTTHAFRASAMRWLLPCILINITVGNQGWTVGPLTVGEVFFWFIILLASLVVVSSHGPALWPFAVVAAVPATRIAEAATGGAAPTAVAYLVALNGLFLLAALQIALERPDLAYRQVRIFLLLCLPIMFLQVLGVGEWTQALNTEYWVTEDEIGAAKLVFPTLFVPAESVRYSIGQGRPAGLLHSNNVLSLVIIFGFVLQFSRIRSRRVTWTDLAFIACMVLAMAKIVIAAFLLMALWMLWRGTSLERARIRHMLGATALLYGLYALLFPGLFALQLSLGKFYYSIGVRLADLAATLIGDESQRLALLAVLNAPSYSYFSPEDVGALSGYAALIRLAPLLLPAALIVLPVFVRGLRRLGPEGARTRTAAVLALLAVGIYPAAVPFFRAQLYWYVVAFAAVPLVTVLAPGIAARARARSELATTPAAAG